MALKLLYLLVFSSLPLFSSCLYLICFPKADRQKDNAVFFLFHEYNLFLYLVEIRFCFLFCCFLRFKPTGQESWFGTEGIGIFQVILCTSDPPKWYGYALIIKGLEYRI